MSGSEYPDVSGLSEPVSQSTDEVADAFDPGPWRSVLAVIAVPLMLIAAQCLMTSAQLGIFEFDRAAIRAGELWRLVTAHVVHADLAHALQNAWALTGLLIFARRPLHMLRTLLLAKPLLGLAMWWLLPGMQVLRGASGLLFVGLVWLLLLPGQCRWPVSNVWRNALWLVLACKLLADFMALASGSPTDSGGGWVVAGGAHLLGAFIGWQLARTTPGGARQHRHATP